MSGLPLLAGLNKHTHNEESGYWSQLLLYYTTIQTYFFIGETSITCVDISYCVQS